MLKNIGEGENSMNLKKISIVVIVSLLMLPLLVFPTTAQSGPKKDTLTIHIYDSPTPENWDLEKGILDINDWPLSKDFIDRWVANPNIYLRSYSEMGEMQIDMNNQRWPIGCEGHKTYDPETETWKTFYDDTCQWCQKSRVFRIALAYLCDKDAIIRDILKGYGYRMDTFVPMIALSGYTDYPGLEATHHDLGDITHEGLIRHYNPTTAAALLDYAGFVQGATPNPYYDASFPSSAQYIRIDPKTGTNLREMVFYIRMDDPNRMSAGLLMADAMKKSGIPTKAVVTERTVCYQRVMVEFDYDLYTGGWSLGADPTWTWTLFGSPFSGFPWCSNYAGFNNHEYDTLAYASYTGTTMAIVKQKCLEAQVVYANMTPVINLWAAAAVKAYKSAYEGVVNNFGYGVDNYFTFLNMENKTVDPAPYQGIDWGFKSDIEGLHVVCAEWLWDWNVLGLMYDTGYGREPFDLSVRYPWLFETWDIGTYTHPTKGTCTNTTYHLRTNVLWHDGSVFDADDVVFTLNFKKACGSGVAWEYPDLKYIYQVIKKDQWTVEVKYNYESVFAPDIAGFLTYIQRDLWMAANAKYGWNYDETSATFTPASNRLLVRDYHPWTDDANTNGIIDIKEDGTGAWVFVEYKKGDYVKLSANTNFYRTQASIEADIKSMFHWGVGDINELGSVDIPDLFLIAKAWHTTPASGGSPGAWGAWNSACDIAKAPPATFEYIDVWDLSKASANYGKVVG